MSTQKNNKISTRLYINNNLDFLIKESIYYRSNNENIFEPKRLVVWQADEDTGSIHIP